MAAKYHINFKGETGSCRARFGKCPFGGENEHFDSEAEARAAYEKTMLDQVIAIGARKAYSDPREAGLGAPPHMNVGFTNAQVADQVRVRGLVDGIGHFDVGTIQDPILQRHIKALTKIARDIDSELEYSGREEVPPNYVGKYTNSQLRDVTLTYGTRSTILKINPDDINSEKIRELWQEGLGHMRAIDALVSQEPPFRKFENSQLHDFGDGRPQVFAREHPNGGGWVADTAEVATTARVAPLATVSGFARVEGEAQIVNEAVVTDEAVVKDFAQVADNARISGKASVGGHALVRGEARVFGYAKVYDEANISGRAQIYGNAVAFDKARVTNQARLLGNAQVYENGQVLDNGYVTGKIFGNGVVEGDAIVRTAIIFGNARIRQNAIIDGSSVRLGGDMVIGARNFVNHSTDLSQLDSTQPEA